MVRSTSCTEARITSVRSITTSSFSEGEIEERQPRQRLFSTLSAVSIMFRARLPENRDDHAGFPRRGRSEVANVFDGNPPPWRCPPGARFAPRMSSDDQRLVLVGLEKLIGIGNRKGAILVGQRALLARFEFDDCNALRTCSRLMP